MCPILTLVLIAIAIQLEFFIAGSLIIGLIAFGFCFAINSALHSYLILSFSDADDVMLSVGFYYSANAVGRLLGTLLSGLAYEIAGLIGTLAITLAMLIIATFFTMLLESFSNTKNVGVSS